MCIGVYTFAMKTGNCPSKTVVKLDFVTGGVLL